MSAPDAPNAGTQRHGDIFSRGSGAMLIHVQRESGLAHRTISIAAWQVQVLRALSTRLALALLVLGAASWVFFATQAARVPLLTSRLARMEEDARRLDTLQQALGQLQQRYDQVQRMLSASNAATTKGTAGAVTPRAPGPVERTGSTPAKKDSASKAIEAKPRAESGAGKKATKPDSSPNSRMP